MTALVHLPKFSGQRELQVEVLTNRLLNILSIFDPGESKYELSVSIRRSIIDPVIYLAHRLHLSVDKYIFGRNFPQDASLDNRRLSLSSAVQYDCVDLGGKRINSFPEIADAMETEEATTYLFDLMPRTEIHQVTQSKNNFHAPTVLVKSKILISESKDDEPVMPQDGLTVMGWLEDELKHPHRHPVKYNGHNESFLVL